MVQIAPQHIEWAVINRLKAMLVEPPPTPFSVTHTLAIFSSIVLWTKERAWVGGNTATSPSFQNQTDRAAAKVRQSLQSQQITDAPWDLPLLLEAPARAPSDLRASWIKEPINSGFVGMDAADFIKWLRDNLAHGDGRKIMPFHRTQGGRTFLVGFQIVGKREFRSIDTLTLHLLEQDMVRIGAALADIFCSALSGDDHYFEQDAATAVLEIAA